MIYTMTDEQMQAFENNLRQEEFSEGTIQKYTSVLRAFFEFLPADKVITKERLLAWKNQLISNGLAASTINVMISAVNSFFNFLKWIDLQIKQLKMQRRIFRDKERELTKEEYMRLLNAAKEAGNFRMYYLMQTLGGTGIRISELRFITVESLQEGSVTVDCKGKQRTVLLSEPLRKALRTYCKEANITSGPIFVTKSGKPMDRSNIWKEMRKLCAAANVEAGKVFPHNFRHLFAVTFYKLEKDIAKLADILGHASINTTRIYVMESSAEHERQMARLGLVV